MLPTGLLELVKNRLDITWQDENTDKKITTMIENGISALNSLNGLTNDYLSAGKAQSLLLSYVMYDMANALDDFKKNYHSDIVAFINWGKVKSYAESKDSESV